MTTSLCFILSFLKIIYNQNIYTTGSYTVHDLFISDKLITLKKRVLVRFATQKALRCLHVSDRTCQLDSYFSDSYVTHRLFWLSSNKEGISVMDTNKLLLDSHPKLHASPWA